MLILNFHGAGGRSCTIHRALHYDPKHVGFDVSMIDWKIMVYDMVSALKYLHDHDILHNDIKSDNIVIDDRCAALHCVLIDFGKSCFAVDGKLYKLSPQERRRYSLEHPQVAPDLRDSRCKQSKFSDVYSIGWVITQINDKFLKINLVASHGSMCTQYNGTKRPTTDELYTTIRNLFNM